MTQNQIAYKNAVENERHNQASEAELTRHQKVTEALQNWANALQNYQIAVNAAHYARMDAETERSNKARENEALRSNLAGEYIKERANQISAASVGETSRHQKVMESLQETLNKSVIEENKAKAQQAYSSSGLLEAQTVTEGYRPGQIVNEIDLTNAQANLNRSRITTETTQQYVNISQTVRNLTGAVGDVFQAVGNLMSKGASGGASAPASAADSFLTQWNKIKQTAR